MTWPVANGGYSRSEVDSSTRSPFQYLYPMRPQDMAQGFLLGVPCALLGVMTDNRIYRIFRPTDHGALYNATVNDLRHRNFAALYRIPYICVGGPILEEIAYRSFLQQILIPAVSMDDESLYSKVKRVCISSTVFAAGHLDFSRSVQRNIFSFTTCFVSGAIWGAVTEHTGNLWASTIAHITNNTMCVLAMKRASRKA